jgi:hypothetical protein
MYKDDLAGQVRRRYVLWAAFARQMMQPGAMAAERDRIILQHARMGTKLSHVALLLGLPRSIVKHRLDKLQAQPAAAAAAAAAAPLNNNPPPATPAPLQSAIGPRSKPVRRPAA